jgi:hypothetical protein
MRVEFVIRCLFASAVVAGIFGATVAQPPAGVKADYSDPKATYRTYIEAVAKCDLRAAKQCWVMDDEAGALDVTIGLWVSTRRLTQAAENKFGGAGVRAVPKGWHRDDLGNAALDLTKARLGDASVVSAGGVAELKVRWREADGGRNPAFEFGEEPTYFRKVGESWKIDGNKMTGLKAGTDFFKPGTWGPMFQDQVAVMSEAAEGIEKGRLKTAKELETFIEVKLTKLKAKYEEERKKSGSVGKQKDPPIP